jgi:hypothetical protein
MSEPPLLEYDERRAKALWLQSVRLAHFGDSRAAEDTRAAAYADLS